MTFLSTVTKFGTGSILTTSQLTTKDQRRINHNFVRSESLDFIRWLKWRTNEDGALIIIGPQGSAYGLASLILYKLTMASFQPKYHHKEQLMKEQINFPK